MNLNSTIENLLGLSPRTTSIGSCLQLSDSVRFEHGDMVLPGFEWPADDYWIIGRELLLYHRIDLADIPNSHRLKVLGQKIRQLSPFERTGQYVFREGSMAMVWLWDEERRSAAVEEMGERYSPLKEHFLRLRAVPESVFYQRGEEGPVSISCVEGVEYQEWNDSALVTSEWRHTSIEDAVPAAANDPWSEVQAGSLVENESFWWRLGMLLLLVVVVFQAGTWVGWQVTNSSLADSVQTQRAEVAQLVNLRNQVRTVKTSNEYLVNWLSEPSQLATLADFDALLPASAEIRQWEYEAGVLKVTISDTNLDNRAYVENLTSGQHFSNVTVEPGAAKGTAIISIEVGSS